MNKIEWKDEYNLEIPAIDRQHRKLFDYLNALRQGIMDHNTVDAINKSLQDLYEYGKEHFSFEEHLMELGDYSVLAEHKVKHQEFNQKIEEYKNKFQQGNELMATDIIVFIKTWLLNHILIEDRKYADYFVKNNFRCSEMD